MVCYNVIAWWVNEMTIEAIKKSMKLFKKLYIDSSEIKVIFIEDITETIQVNFIDDNFVTFATKSSISSEKCSKNYIKVDDLLILRCEGFVCIV